MTCITIVDEEMTKEEAENFFEAILDTFNYHPDRVLVNNKEVYKQGDKTLKEILEHR